ncbi:hypothetical protein ABMY26_06480 (plasmid) [Azospirillum sp. HJ39]|uniref:hypothetical protein n=1 Tax=Azospirillum sp. HJ39 TaxID=3159496 RepID=UPI0035564F11
MLALQPVGVAAAAHLLLARDRAACDPTGADRLVLGVIDAAAVGDPDVSEIRRFYAG